MSTYHTEYPKSQWLCVALDVGSVDCEEGTSGGDVGTLAQKQVTPGDWQESKCDVGLLCSRTSMPPMCGLKVEDLVRSRLGFCGTVDR